MKTNEQLKSSVAEWEQAIIGAAGEESYKVVDDKREDNEENVEEGNEAMLERDLRRLSLDPASIDEQLVKAKVAKKQNNETRGKGRRKLRARLSLPSASSSEDEQKESDIENVVPVAQLVVPSGVRRSHRQQNIPPTHIPSRYARKTHRGIGRHAFNPLHSESDEEVLDNDPRMDDDAVVYSGPEDDDTGI